MFAGIQEAKLGKKSRRPSRRNRERRQGFKEIQTAEASRMRVAIVTYPKGLDKAGALAGDVELVRAALLYADEVELVSPTATMLAGLSQIATQGEPALLEMMAQFDDDTMRRLGGRSLPDNWRDILPLAPLFLNPDFLDLLNDPNVLALLGMPDAFRGHEDQIAQFRERVGEYRNLMNPLIERFRGKTDDLLTDSGAAEMVPAIDAGILTFSNSGFAETNRDLQSIVSTYLDILRELLADPRIRLLFDDKMGSMVRSFVDAGEMDFRDLTLKHAGEAAVGSGLVARLPTFPQASVDELLTMRQDLSQPLIRYRAAIARLGSKLTYRSIDQESAHEIDDLWRFEVQPALLEIREGLAEHGLVREIVRHIRGSMTAVIEGLSVPAIYIALNQFSEVDNWVAATLAAAGPVSHTAASVATARGDAATAMYRKELFYLYEVDRRLAVN